jgi:hypothetical protein
MVQVCVWMIVQEGGRIENGGDPLFHTICEIGMALAFTIPWFVIVGEPWGLSSCKWQVLLMKISQGDYVSWHLKSQRLFDVNRLTGRAFVGFFWPKAGWLLMQSEDHKNYFSHPCASLTVCVSCDSCFCVSDPGESDSIPGWIRASLCLSPLQAPAWLINLWLLGAWPEAAFILELAQFQPVWPHSTLNLSARKSLRDLRDCWVQQLSNLAAHSHLPGDGTKCTFPSFLQSSSVSLDWDPEIRIELLSYPMVIYIYYGIHGIHLVTLDHFRS